MIPLGRAAAVPSRKPCLAAAVIGDVAATVKPPSPFRREQLPKAASGMSLGAPAERERERVNGGNRESGIGSR